jgi:hypothetical protein
METAGGPISDSPIVTARNVGERRIAGGHDIAASSNRASLFQWLPCAVGFPIKAAPAQRFHVCATFL